MIENPANADRPVPLEKPRRRRWFQFSLRSLMIFTVICAVGSAWVAHKMKRKHREREAVKAIERLDGSAHYDWLSEGHKTPPGPDWMRQLLGENFFSEVAIVNLIGKPKLLDAELEHIEEFSQLKWLDLSFSINVGDPGLEHIRGLTQLQSLDLDGTKITDAGLERLKELTQLQELHLQQTGVTSAGLVHLKGLTQLKQLDLAVTGVTDAGLENLKGLTELKELQLLATPVTAAGVEELHSALPNCRIVFGPKASPRIQPTASGRRK